MRENTSYIVFSILRSVLHNDQMSDADKLLVTEDTLLEVMQVASKHDIAHLIALGVLNNGLTDEENRAKIQQITYRAVYRYEKLKYELEQLCEALENAKIPFLPLKGSVIRKYYAEPWMRTSCDIDILVREDDLRTAVTYLVENLKYTQHERNSHDVSLFSPGGTHIELHYDLVENGRANGASDILATVWNVVTLKEGCCYHYEMPDDMFYFYHVAHMAKHFEGGGCGIRPFMDLWILDHIEGADRTKRDELLKRGNLLRFAEVARTLSKVWFENAEKDSLSKQMEEYILRGGVYGNIENHVTVQQQKKGGKIKYVLSRIFLPYEVIKYHYPILQKHRWLTPFMQVRRWCKLVFRGHAKKAVRELSYNQKLSKEQADKTKIFLDEIGLS